MTVTYHRETYHSKRSECLLLALRHAVKQSCHWSTINETLLVADHISSDAISAHEHTSLVSDKHVPAFWFQSVSAGAGALVWFSCSQEWKWMVHWTITITDWKSRAAEMNKSAITDHVVKENHVINWSGAKILEREDIGKPGRSRSRSGSGKNPTAWTEMEGRTAYRQHMTVFWSRAQNHVTTSLMKLAVGERNVATNLGTYSGCVIEYCFSI